MEKFWKRTCLGLWVLFAFGVSDSSASHPNVIFISIDDLNDWIGCLDGHPQAVTPHIDRLAERGVLFTNAHCAAPACNPSRAAVFTGRAPQVTGVWSNRSGKLHEVYPEGRLLSRAFKDAGYVTLGTGKLLHSKSSIGFDDYYSVEQRWSPLSKEKVAYRDEELSTKGTSNPRHRLLDSQEREVILPLNRMPSDRRPNLLAGESFDWGAFDLPDSEFGDTQITDWAITQLQKRRAQPFFLGVGYYRPHIPLWAPKRFFKRFEATPGILPDIKKDDLKDLGAVARRWALEPVTAGSHATVLKYNQWQAAVEAYLACVSYVDHEVGRLMKALENSTHAGNTLVVLWSDHGWHLGEKQHWGKWTAWERSTRVPLVMVPPAASAAEFAPPGSRCDTPVSLIDLYPTLAEICDVPCPSDLDGQSLVALLKNPGQPTTRIVFTTFDRGNLSLRSKRFRYIRYVDGSEELYDHQSDPDEWTNLVHSPNDQKTLEFFRTQLP